MEIVLALAGGLGLFLYGMTLMSDSLEKAAGAKLRSVLEMFTKNKYIGMLVGIIFTAIIQSSSATTVMVVSFVNAGLMNLYQAAGVIFGANIGTTVTSQLVSFNLSEVAPLFVILGVVMMLFVKRPSSKKIGEVILGFGILFTGLNTMSSAMSVLKDSPTIVGILSSLSNPLMCVLVGFIITAILQSSSVTVSIVLLMATQGLLTLHVCFFIILGCNMGSCTSALIASVSGKKDAKRAAMIHFIFNIIGSTVIFIILMIGMNFVEGLIIKLSGQDIGRCVANAHTLFKVFQVIILVPFSDHIVKLTYKIIPGDDKKSGDNYELEFIGDHYMVTPATAVPQVVKEINRMGSIAIGNLNKAMDALIKEDEKLADEVYETEKQIDYMDHEITQYLIRANQLSLPVDDRKTVAALFHVVSDIERIGDHAENISEDARAKIKLGLSFTKDGDQELCEMLSMTDRLLRLSLDMFSSEHKENLPQILELEEQIDQKERAIQNAYIKRLNRQECTAQSGMMFSDLASTLERVADHATNVAFSILDSDPEGSKEPKVLYEE